MNLSKNFKKYIIAWSLLLVIFNVITFVPMIAREMEFTTSFWIGYITITVCFLGQLFFSNIALKEENANKTFYNISILNASFTALILNVIAGSLCMIFAEVIPYWVSMVLCIIVLCFSGISILKAVAVTEIVSEIDTKIKSKTFFIKALTAQVNTMVAMAKSEDVKAECKKVYDAVRYSDPMSNPALEGIEGQISAKVAELNVAINNDDAQAAKAATDIIVIMLNDRNTKCKLLK